MLLGRYIYNSGGKFLIFHLKVCQIYFLFLVFQCIDYHRFLLKLGFRQDEILDTRIDAPKDYV